MIKKTKNISINILAVLVTLFCLLLTCVGVGNAWFTTSQNKGMYVVVYINEYNLSLYQIKTVDEQEVSTPVYTYKKNDKYSYNNYLELSAPLKPEEFIDLKLKIVNEDAGGGVYVRYKFNIYICRAGEDEELAIDLTIGEDFKQDGEYYYYVDDQLNNKLFVTGGETILCTGFEIPYDVFKTLNGGETIRAELLVECVDLENGF